MKYLIIILISIIALVNCKNVKESKQGDIPNEQQERKMLRDTFSCKTITYPLVEYSEEKEWFGYEDRGAFSEIFPRAMAMENEYIYIIDQLNSVFKRINIITNELVVSDSISRFKYGGIYDIELFGEYILCTTRSKVFKLNCKMQVIDMKPIDRGYSEFYENCDTLMDIYIPEADHKVLTINKKLEIVSTRTENLFEVNSFLVNDLGNEVTIDNHIIYLKDSKYEGALYGENNLDFNGEVLAFYKLDLENKKLVLNICKDCE